MYAPTISADQFRSAAMQKIASRGRNQHIAKIAYAEEMEKIAITGLIGRGVSWLGRGLSRMGAKGLGGRAQARGGRMMLNRAKKLEGQARNMAQTAVGVPAAERATYVKQYASKASNLRSRAAGSFRGARRDLGAAARNSTGLEHEQFVSRVQAAQQGLKDTGIKKVKATKPRAAPKPAQPAAPATPAQPAAGGAQPPLPNILRQRQGAEAAAAAANRNTAAATAPTPPANPKPKPQPNPSAEEPGWVQQNMGWGQPGQQQLGDDAGMVQRFSNWWGGLNFAQQRNNALLGLGGAGAIGFGGNAMLNGNNRTTVVYR